MDRLYDEEQSVVKRQGVMDICRVNNCLNLLGMEGGSRHIGFSVLIFF